MKKKFLSILFVISVLISCKDTNKNEKKEKQEIDTAKIETKPKVDSSIPIANTIATIYKSNIRPNQKLSLDTVYIDTVQFKNFNDGGDYFLFIAQKNSEHISLVYNLISNNKFDFLRGDEIEIKWKMDSIWIAGEGETLDFSEWLVDAKKIKEGKVSQFLKKYGKPIKYINHHDSYSDSYLDYLNKLVVYYLANSKQELVRAHVNNPDKSELIYSIEERKENGKNYTVMGISNNFESHTSIIQWLYLDNESGVLYEYDLVNDKLVEYK